MSATIQLRRGTAATWTSANPTLAQGEAGLETDTGKLKLGDGTTAWNSLAYFTGSAGVTGFATPSLALGTAAAAGAASTVIRSDATIAAFDATVPVTQALGDAAAAGTAAVAARRDHKHGMPALSTATPLVESGSGAAGTGTLSSREDHVHPAGGGGGGLTQAYVGYNTVGASTETCGFNAQYFCKSVTLATACLVTSIGAYLSSGAGSCMGPAVAVYSDASSAPSEFLGGVAAAPILNLSRGARWVDIPTGIWLAAATYWLVIRLADTGAAALPIIAYDTGSDLKTTTTGTNGYFPDAIATSAASRKYSIRANTIH